MKSVRKQEMKPLLEKVEKAISALKSADGNITLEFLAIQLVTLVDPNHLKPELIAGDSKKASGLAGIVVGGMVASAIESHKKELYAAEHGVEKA